MDNSDPYFESISLTEEELSLGRNRQQLLHRQICTKFQPYREHFLSLPIAIIKHPRPQLTPSHSLTLRDNLKIDRQVKYLKNTLAEDYCQPVLEEMLGEDQYSPIKKMRNLSVVFEGKYYWAEQTKIRWIKIADFLSKSKLQANREVWSATLASPVNLMDIYEQIYELALHGSLFYVRTPRSLIVIDPVAEKVVEKYPSQCEIITFHHYEGKDGKKVLMTTYEERCSQLYQQELRSEGKMQLWCKIDGLINAMWTITDSEVVICKENAILVADRRRKAVSDLHRRAQCHNNRIYSGLSLGDSIFGPRYFLTTQSKTVNIYDVRKAHEPLLAIPHYCEQAPPSVLQLYSYSFPSLTKDLDLTDFDTFLTESQLYQSQNPLLIAHSPYTTGASLLTELSIAWSSPEELLRKEANGETNQFSNKFQLLYDAGKLQEHYHPLSITPIQLDSQVGFLHLDNFYGIALQILQKMPHNQNIKGYKKTGVFNQVYQRVDFLKQEGVEELKAANLEWHMNHIMEKQFQGEEEDYWSETMGEQLELQERQFENKVIRYADLKKFYHQVLEESKSYPLPDKIREQETLALPKPKPPAHPTQPASQQQPSLALPTSLPSSLFCSLLQEWS